MLSSALGPYRSYGAYQVARPQSAVARSCGSESNGTGCRVLGLSGSGSTRRGMVCARGVVRIGEGDSIGPVAISQSLAIRFEICFEGAAGGALQPLIAAVDSSADVFLDF